MTLVQPSGFVLELLSQLADHGLIVLLKVDGERRSGRWTLLVSGPPLGDDHFRWDGDDLDAGLTKAMGFLEVRLPEALG
ncbi:MAG TPA: hypothetical protein VE781_08510 [Kineosporiaceae bacterium]|jgi:hypothetical protein|nr:hypothetical protein [Kineosporiaceae bacterium]